MIVTRQIFHTTGVRDVLRSFLQRHTPAGFSLLAIGLGLLCACSPKDPRQAIEGTWKIDSVFTFYNGFGSMETTIVDLEQYTYLPDGKVNVSWSGTTRTMLYDLSAQDTLKYIENNHEVSRYQILKLGGDRLVLRKDKPPLFSGAKQERYEIRYFSRVPLGN
ncbi:lipocalin family protein [Chryseolinea sp. T2]|uniref:lipocalin family protein n=1 Tax=Chryseolinea sp. T2 TaxID=3129255 RepID=UPI0030775941